MPARIHVQTQPPPTSQFKLGTVNVSTARHDARLQDIVDQVAARGLLACALQETKRIGDGSAVVRSRDRHGSPVLYHLYWSGFTRKRHDGVGILIKVDKDTHVDDVTYGGARHLAIDVTHRGCKLFLISSYAPCEMGNRSSDSTKSAFYKKLIELAQSRPKKSRLCILGDMNATSEVTSSFTRFNERSYSLQGDICNDNGRRLKEFARASSLSILNSYFEHRRPSHMLTWHSRDTRTRKCIDYILVDSLLRSWAVNCRVRNSFKLTPETDHRLLVATFRAPTTKKKGSAIRAVAVQV